MKRRDFVRNSAFISAALFLPFQKMFGKTFLLCEESKIWIELIDYARWTASPHNVQPWKMKIISATEADLYYDTSRLLRVVDPDSAFTIAGLSMFIESLSIAAGQLGYRVIAEHSAEPQLDYSASGVKFFAKLHLVSSSEKENTDRELIKLRKTSRLHYDGRVLDAEIVNDLKEVVSSYGSELNYSSDKNFINSVLELNSRAIIKGSDDDAARNELGKWIRTTDEEAEEKKDGLWYRCMGFPPKTMYNFFFHHDRFQSKWKKKILNEKLIHSAKGTSNLAWITGRFENRNDWVKAGAMLQYLWLKMTKYSVFLQPLGAILNEPWALEEFKQKINYEKKSGTLWLLFRLGYSDEPPRSLRLDVKDILIS